MGDHASMPPDRPSASSRSPLPILWQPTAVMWVILATEALSIILALAPGIGGNRWIYFGICSLLLQWVALLTLGATYVLRGPLMRLPLVHMTWAVVLLLLSSTILLGSLALLIVPRSLLIPNEDGWLAWLRTLGLVLVAGILGALAFQNHWKSRLSALRAQQAELDALRARVNPHFLFNTLNTATALVHDQPDQAERVLLDLSDLFRAALSGNEETGLEQELLLTRRYLEIEQLRLGDRLSVSWHLPVPLPNINVPTLALQTLAENAIHHGIEARPGTGDVTIEVIPDTNAVILRVSNPLAEESPATPRHQVGLAASRARIEAMTAGLGELRTRQDAGRFIAEIILPI